MKHIKLFEQFNEGQKERDAEDVIDQMLPILTKISQSDRKKMDGYTDNAKYESPLVDIFWDSGIADDDDYYDEIQDLVNNYFDENDVFGSNAIKDLKKLKAKL